MSLAAENQPTVFFPHGTPSKLYLRRIREILGIKPSPADPQLHRLPFLADDITAGAENEFQTVVKGSGVTVDLPLVIRESNYYKNINRRSRSGELSLRQVADLTAYIDGNADQIWENSWVRFPRKALSRFADDVFRHDLLRDKSDSGSPLRGDADRFFVRHDGEEHLRLPVSYLLKLALADAVSQESGAHPAIRAQGEKLLHHFLNDNTSPEIFSFYTVRLDNPAARGAALADETLQRFLLVQLLAYYANNKFGLKASGQEAVVYFAPHPPVRQKQLNECISDSFYRELFMSPCLSGWARGEKKYEYMGLCHQVLSRSQMNAVRKLKDAGIITRNLVVLPNISNICLANNGTHISLGSRTLTRLLSDNGSGYGAADEKYLGDLAIKIVEHFLPLVVGTYSAAPYRLDFQDFHPEKVLGFLPHELDYTHLRMIWRRWKKKASLRVIGQPLTPFGPEWLDRIISRLLRLKGDIVPDFRLIDYLVSIMSTDQSPSLDGRMGNDLRLKKDLADMGVFDTHMSLYQIYRNRVFADMGFTGFEGRYYSLFENIRDDMGNGTNLQALLTALAWKYMITDAVTHDDIPDDPTVESERRQIFFGRAIGIPTFFVNAGTANRFLKKILSRVRRTRLSRRYPGYVRVYHAEYCRALVDILEEDAADLIEMNHMRDTVSDLRQRIDSPRHTAYEKLMGGILGKPHARSALKLDAGSFNRLAESYYRETLREKNMTEAYDRLEFDALTAGWERDEHLRPILTAILDGQDMPGFLAGSKSDLMENRLDDDRLLRLIHLLLMSIAAAETRQTRNRYDSLDTAPVC
ncbi:MAG: hypothetical protein AB1724_03645 [Thermodesulfobacteriota bacterium]